MLLCVKESHYTFENNNALECFKDRAITNHPGHKSRSFNSDLHLLITAIPCRL